MLFRGMLVTDLSGSVDGVTASRNRSGAYFRERVTPIDPATDQQLAIRDAMTDANTAWVAASQSLRDAWNAYAIGRTMRNRIGQTRPATGRHLFFQQLIPQYQLLNCALVTRTINTAVPTADGGDFASQPSIAIASSTTATLTFTNSATWNNVTNTLYTGICIHCSEPQPPTIGWFRGPFRPFAFIAANTISPPVSPRTVVRPNSGINIFPDFISGQRYFFTVHLLWQGRGHMMKRQLSAVAP